jgi:hypothetical protein
MNSEWNIRSCADQCATCQKKFMDREMLMSRLRFMPDGYLREDFCSACWPTRSSGTGAEVSAWAAIWIAPEKKAPEALKKETAESLLREMMETDDLSRRNVIFILAVMLERRRILVEKEVKLQPDGQKIRVYEHKQTGECFVVTDPQLRLKEIECVQMEVMELLGIPPPPGKGPRPVQKIEKSDFEGS